MIYIEHDHVHEGAHSQCLSQERDMDSIRRAEEPGRQVGQPPIQKRD